jgi:NADH:ubiquinone oxidoreductase subunit E
MKKENVNSIIERHKGAGRDSLIPILQNVQDAQGYLSKEAVIEIGKHLKLPTSKIYGVATFYNQFRFEATGKYHIMVCRGTACHVKGSAAILAGLENDLNIKAGNTTRDGLFSIEVVACIGACGLAPVISINGEFYANLAPSDIKGILDIYRNKEKSQKAGRNIQ